MYELQMSREQLAQELEVLRARFAKLFHVTPIPHMLATLEEGRFLDVNDSFLQLFGYSREQVIGSTSIDLGIWPDTEERARRVTWPLTEHGSIRDEEVRVRTARGDERVMLLSAVVLDLDGQRCVLCQGQDITARKQAESGLRRAEEQFREFMDNSPALAFIKDEAGRYVYANRSWEQFLDRPRSDWLGKSDCELWPAVAGELAEHDRQVLETDQPMELYEMVADQAGNPREWFVYKFPLHDGGGRRLLGGIALDITERRRAEEQLREQAALLDRATDAILVRDLNNRIVYWNRAAERLYGWTRAEAIGRDADEVLYGTTPAPTEPARQIMLERDEWHGELTQVTRNGKPVTVASSWTLLREPDGQARSVLVINSDITEKKRLEAQYLHAQRMELIGTMASGVAHDLNNLLTPIFVAVELLRRPAAELERQALLETIENCAHRGAETVQQIVAFVRGVRGERLTIEIKPLMEEVHRMLLHSFPKSIELWFRVAGDLWRVEGDATQLTQVLVNLSVNARDAMPDGGLLTVTVSNVRVTAADCQLSATSRPGNYVQIRVEDTGTGMTPETLDKIFDPFFTTKGEGKGTGLGLSTVQAIVKGHGGFINVHSEPGKGSRFLVHLPALDRPETRQSEEVYHSLPDGNGELILVIDDEASIREIARTTLETYGYRTLTAIDGSEGMTVFTRHQREIDLVLCDMTMPIMDGATTIRAMRKLAPSLPIIAVSGLLSYGTATELLGLRHGAFLEKPFSAETLLKTVAHVLRTR